MLDVINGGVYAVDLGGTEAYEFKGVHPALVIRTLREEQMYVVIPLTTYTAERWERCKRKGFGSRIHSTNSIARIDKMNIVTRKCIQGRYYNAGSMVVPNIAEVKAIISEKIDNIGINIKKVRNLLQVEIKLCQDKLLTFKKRYDTFKAQKGSSDA